MNQSILKGEKKWLEKERKVLKSIKTVPKWPRLERISEWGSQQEHML